MQVEMKLAEMRVEQFGEMLSSDAPAPGGGSAAALEAAMGAGLVAMVCRLTEEKAQFARYRAELLALRQRVEDLRLALLDVMDQDTDAFLQVSRAFPMPRPPMRSGPPAPRPSRMGWSSAPRRPWRS